MKISICGGLKIASFTSFSIFSFTPYQGWKVVDSVKVDDIVDFAVFNKREIGDVLNIYVIERSQTSKLFKLYSKDYMPALSLNYGRFKWNVIFIVYGICNIYLFIKYTRDINAVYIIAEVFGLK